MNEIRWDSRDEPSELNAVAEYPQINRVAVVALILGVISVGAIFFSLLLLPAIAGALLAFAALWSIGRASRPQLGRQAALAALALCLTSAAWGVAWRAIRQQVLFAQASERADQWFEMVQAGRLGEAYQLHLSQANRQTPGTDLGEFLKTNREAREDYQVFFHGDPLQRIVDEGPRGKTRLLGLEKVLDESYAGQTKDDVTLRYAFDYQQDGQPRTVAFLVHMGRTRDKGSHEVRWEVRSLQIPK